jgi:hypothetical protein
MISEFLFERGKRNVENIQRKKKGERCKRGKKKIKVDT